MSEAELLRARAKCFFEWATMARELADPTAADYLTALAMECSDDAAALDAAGGERSTTAAGKARSAKLEN
jgi:hypothetical protein